MFIKNLYYIRLDYAKLWNICEYLILHSVSVTFQKAQYLVFFYKKYVENYCQIK